MTAKYMSGNIIKLWIELTVYFETVPKFHHYKMNRVHNLPNSLINYNADWY